jgi:hypothetical protein
MYWNRAYKNGTGRLEEHSKLRDDIHNIIELRMGKAAFIVSVVKQER